MTCEEHEEKDAQDVLSRLTAEKRVLVEQQAGLRQQAASPLSQAWGEAHALVDALRESVTPDDVRVRVRAALRRIVSEIWVLVCRQPGRKRVVCFAQLHFAGTSMNRAYVIRYTPPITGIARTPGSALVMACPLQDGEDLRAGGQELIAFLEGVVVGNK